MMTDYRYHRYIEAGLEEDEINLLNEPLANLNEQQRFHAIVASDKYVAFVNKEKATERERIANLSEEERISQIKPAVWAEGIYRG